MIKCKIIFRASSQKLFQVVIVAELVMAAHYHNVYGGKRTS